MKADLLVAVLEEARGLGFLGPGPVTAHREHAHAFAAAVAAVPSTVVDLGSGGGVPGLVLAMEWQDAEVRLVDSMAKRCAFLEGAVARLGIADRVSVTNERAEVLGREDTWRLGADLVTARSFGSPAVTAECAAPLLVDGGVLLVSEPPDPSHERWPTEGLALLGLADEGVVATGHAHIRRLRRVGPLDDRYPRRSGVPTKRPLW